MCRCPRAPHRGAAVNATEAAKLFHDTYERLAPSFGYETRADTKQFDPESPNGRLMIAVCDVVATAFRSILTSQDTE